MGHRIPVKLARLCPERRPYLRAACDARGLRLIVGLSYGQHLGAASRTGRCAGKGQRDLRDDLPLERRASTTENDHTHTGIGSRGSLIRALACAAGSTRAPRGGSVVSIPNGCAAVRSCRKCCQTNPSLNRDKADLPINTRGR